MTEGNDKGKGSGCKSFGYEDYQSIVCDGYPGNEPTPEEDDAARADWEDNIFRISVRLCAIIAPSSGRAVLPLAGRPSSVPN
jgi:hypothetical protein